jgi:hypothetical protein
VSPRGQSSVETPQPLIIRYKLTEVNNFLSKNGQQFLPSPRLYDWGVWFAARKTIVRSCNFGEVLRRLPVRQLVIFLCGVRGIPASGQPPDDPTYIEHPAAYLRRERIRPNDAKPSSNIVLGSGMIVTLKPPKSFLAISENVPASERATNVLSKLTDILVAPSE